MILQGLLSAPSMPSSTHSRRCAILSTFDLPRVRYKISDDDLWRHLSRNSSYWLNDIWIIPIHRAHPVEHWVLATVYLPSSQLFLFDSIGARKPWRTDVKVCIISRLLGEDPE
jgi:hypothetical protein